MSDENNSNLAKMVPVDERGQHLRMWAIEQVVAHRSGAGLAMDAVLREAEQLIAFVTETK